jgi:hypothetical protein
LTADIQKPVILQNLWAATRILTWSIIVLTRSRAALDYKVLSI